MKEKKNKKEVTTTNVVETTNAEKFDIKALRSSALVSGASGEKSNDIYRKSVYVNVTTIKEKTHLRGKIRKLLIAYMQSFIALANNPEKLATLKKDFDDFYRTTYQVQDFSVNSVLASNASELTKSIVAKGMQIAKKA